MFVGRTAELTFLQQRLQHGHRSRRSAVVVMSGEPGIGKTRLGQFTASQASALESHLRTLPGERLVELAAGREEELAWVFPSVAAALGRRTAQAPARLAVFEAVGALLVRLAGRAPVALILDNIHDGDPRPGSSLPTSAATRSRPPSSW